MHRHQAAPAVDTVLAVLPRRPLQPLACAAAALVVVACGSTATSTSLCSPVPSATPATPRASAGALTVSADRGLVPRGGQVQLTVTAAGPVTFGAPCSGPASLVISDPTGIHVYSASPAARPGELCGAVALGAGQTAEYRLSWDVDPTLPSGRYAIAVTLGDLPEVSVLVDVAGGVGGAPQC